jgi:hypothetical protein
MDGKAPTEVEKVLTHKYWILLRHLNAVNFHYWENLPKEILQILPATPGYGEDSFWEDIKALKKVITSADICVLREHISSIAPCIEELSDSSLRDLVADHPPPGPEFTGYSSLDLDVKERATAELKRRGHDFNSAVGERMLAEFLEQELHGDEGHILRALGWSVGFDPDAPKVEKKEVNPSDPTGRLHALITRCLGNDIRPNHYVILCKSWNTTPNPIKTMEEIMHVWTRTMHRFEREPDFRGILRSVYRVNDHTRQRKMRKAGSDNFIRVVAAGFALEEERRFSGSPGIVRINHAEHFIEGGPIVSIAEDNEEGRVATLVSFNENHIRPCVHFLAQAAHHGQLDPSRAVMLACFNDREILTYNRFLRDFTYTPREYEIAQRLEELYTKGTNESDRTIIQAYIRIEIEDRRPYLDRDKITLMDHNIDTSWIDNPRERTAKLSSFDAYLRSLKKKNELQVHHDRVTASFYKRRPVGGFQIPKRVDHQVSEYYLSMGEGRLKEGLEDYPLDVQDLIVNYVTQIQEYKWTNPLLRRDAPKLTFTVTCGLDRIMETMWTTCMRPDRNPEFQITRVPAVQFGAPTYFFQPVGPTVEVVRDLVVPQASFFIVIPSARIPHYLRITPFVPSARVHLCTEMEKLEASLIAGPDRRECTNGEKIFQYGLLPIIRIGNLKVSHQGVFWVTIYTEEEVISTSRFTLSRSRKNPSTTLETDIYSRGRVFLNEKWHDIPAEIQDDESLKRMNIKEKKKARNAAQ